MVHPVSPVASPHASGLSRRLLLRSAVGIGLSAAGAATFTGCGRLPLTFKPARPPRIGALTPGAPHVEASADWGPLRVGLSEAGWIEGQTISIEWRSAEG